MTPQDIRPKDTPCPVHGGVLGICCPMTTPDRLEQVLTDLEVLRESYENAPATGPFGLSDLRLRRAKFASGLVDTESFLFAKLRAAMEMEKALGNWQRTLIRLDDMPQEMKTAITEAKMRGHHALTAW